MELLLLLVKNTAADFDLGWIITIVGFCIVLISLYILSWIFNGIASYFTKKDAKPAEPKTVKVVEKPVVKAVEGDAVSPEVVAAIGMALYLSTNLHDEESNVITMERRQTSWNSKSYGVRHWNR